jgi:hypothetical protein
MVARGVSPGLEDLRKYSSPARGDRENGVSQ